jgi:hypothetical protein
VIERREASRHHTKGKSKMDPEKLIETVTALIGSLRDDVTKMCADMAVRHDELAGAVKKVAADAAGSRERVNTEMREDKKRDNDEDGDDPAKQNATRVAADSVGVDRGTFAALASSVLTMKKQLDASNRPSDDLNSFADEQSRCDAVMRALGSSAVPPMAHESLVAYKIRSHRAMQSHSPKWKSVDLNLIASDSVALENVLGEIRADAVLAANSPAGMKEFEHREITETLPGGHRSSRFIGSGTIFKQLTRPVRHVAYIGTRRDQASAH